MQDAVVISALVGITEGFEYLFGFRVTVAGLADELVSNDQAKHALSALVVRVSGNNVTTDGFRFVELIEITIVSCLGEGLFDAALGDRLQLVIHKRSLVL